MKKLLFTIFILLFAATSHATNKDITQLTELATQPADDDWGYILDTSDTTDGASGTDKKIQYINLKQKRYIYFRLYSSATDTAADTTIEGDFRFPKALTVTDVGAFVDTAGTGSVTTFDINEAGTSILGTKITIDDGEKSSETAATPPVISDAAIAADAVITVDVDGVASGTAPKGGVVWMEVRDA